MNSIRSRRLPASVVVLGLLCLMYLITYVDRVNVATAATDIRKELGLSNTQLGLLFSAFAYPYAIFQVFGGWIGDRVGPRWTLFVCGLIWAVATIFTGLAGGLTAIFLARLLLGLGEGATFPVATRAMQSWTPPDRRGFAQGLTHAFARGGNAITPPIVAALIALVTWRGSFIALGCVSLVWVIAWVWYFRDVPADHSGMTDAELAVLPNRGQRSATAHPDVPWRRLAWRMLPVTFVYFCYGWTLWLYLNWLPSFFSNQYGLNVSRSALFSSTVFACGVAGDYLGGVVSDAIFRRTGSLQRARRDVIVVAFTASCVCLLPILVTTSLTTAVLSLGAAFFCAELVIGPMWSIPMDVAGAYSGTASGFMNTGSALAAILSPLAFGFVADLTGNWHLPFVGSLALLLAGAIFAFTMHPEVPFEALEPRKAAV